METDISGCLIFWLQYRFEHLLVKKARANIDEFRYERKECIFNFLTVFLLIYNKRALPAACFVERTIGFWQILFPAVLELGWRIPHLHPLWQTVTTSAFVLLQDIRDNMGGSAWAKGCSSISSIQLSAPACWQCREQCREQCSCPVNAPLPWQLLLVICVTGEAGAGKEVAAP